MSLLGYKKCVELDDTAIVFIGHDTMTPIVIKKGATTQTKYGALRHNDLIGKEYGAKVRTVNARGWVYILHPTPELWTVNLPHRTQILYFPDITMVTMQLELKPGALVAEAGTGSGSMSHSLARTIAPDGHLYSFEYHEQRVELARAEFKQHGLGDVVTVTHRDVCENGFGLDEKIKVDAVFLDLPSPDKVLGHAKAILKQDGGRICTFSPCIEQVQRTCLEYERQGFSDVAVMECLLRNYDARTVSFPVPYLGIENPEEKEEGTLSTQTVGQGSIGNHHKNKSDGDAGSNPAPDKAQAGEQDDESKTKDSTTTTTTTKRTNQDVATGDESKTDDDGSKKLKQNDKEDSSRRRGKAKATAGNYSVKCAVPTKEMPGHTGYLTFATLYVV